MLSIVQSFRKSDICRKYSHANTVFILQLSGNGGLNSYLGYNNNNYNGQRNLGFGYYRNTDQYGFGPSREANYYSGTGYRGYN